ncbi:hypothetical protein ACFY4H_22490 [Streptomyces althioticus]
MPATSSDRVKRFPGASRVKGSCPVTNHGPLSAPQRYATGAAMTPSA